MAKRPSKKTAKKTSLVSRTKKSRSERVILHKSFKRSYREDYERKLEVPGILAHLFGTFKILFKNWKVFLPLLILVVILNSILVTLMSENMYVQFQDILDETSKSFTGGELGNVAKAGLLLISTITSGGLTTNMTESQGIFFIFLLLLTWLVTIFLLRHIMAGHKIKLRDALYNAGAPIISTFIVFFIVFLECIPIFIFIILYSTAENTGFLDMPFYALLFFLFSVLMFLMSGYWLSSSTIALVSVSAPGLYPMKAVRTASDLMAGRRIKYVLRLLGLFIFLAIIWVLIMLPLILFDLWMKQFEWTAGIPFIPICLATMTVFTVIFIAAYLYQYYRWMLDYDED